MSVRWRTVIVCLCSILAGSAVLAAENKLPAGFVLEPVISGFERPSALALSGDGRAFVAERYTGRVYVIRDGRLVTTPLVTVAVESGADEGLLDLAFDPRGPYLFLYFTEAGTDANVVTRYTVIGDTGRDAFRVLTLPNAPGHTRVGGGIAIGNDGKLYVSTGDMETGAHAQDDAHLCGKILRLNTDGRVPDDNPTPGSAIYAKGFRDGEGVAALPGVTTLYMTDRGPAGGYDELNAIRPLANHGWPTFNGPQGGTGYTHPLESKNPLVDPRGLAAYGGTFYPPVFRNAVLWPFTTGNDIARTPLTGPNLDQAGPTVTFYDADAEWDGGADTQCPATWMDLATNADGIVYAVADHATGANKGLYRFVYHAPGAREVARPGSIAPLSVRKASGSDLTLAWENLDRNAWVGTKRGAHQPAEKYTLWEGTLPISGGAYTHGVKKTTNGTAVNPGLLSDVVSPATGNTYYLVSAQGANLEGSLGLSTAGAERPKTGKPVTDWCNEIGWFTNELKDPTDKRETKCDGIDNDADGRIDESCAGRWCFDDFRKPNGSAARLVDQFGNSHSLYDYRGSVIHLDISALNCGYCRQQAPEFADMYDDFKGRGFVNITVLVQSYATMAAIPPANCATEINNWIAQTMPGSDDLVVCGADDDGNGKADIYEQFGNVLYCYYGSDTNCLIWQRCNGTPMNFYFDQGMFNYQFYCGKTDAATSRDTLLLKLPAERCE